MEKFKNKTIIITGAGKGLGLAAAKELASQGANLALVDYDEEGLGEAEKNSKRPIQTQNFYPSLQMFPMRKL